MSEEQLDPDLLEGFERMLEIEVAGDPEGATLDEHHQLAAKVFEGFGVPVWSMVPLRPHREQPTEWIQQEPQLFERWQSARKRWQQQEV